MSWINNHVNFESPITNDNHGARTIFEEEI